MTSEPQRTADVDAGVVSSGPNGLAAALVLATAGLRAEVFEAARLLLSALAHAAGWPLLRGGSQRIADAMVAELAAVISLPGVSLATF